MTFSAVTFSRLGTFAHRGRPEQMPTAHVHPHLEFNYLHAGWMTYQCGRHRVRLESGRLFAFWAARPHALIETSPDADFTVFAIPAAVIADWRLGATVWAELTAGAIFSGPASSVDLDVIRTELQSDAAFDQDTGLRALHVLFRRMGSADSMARADHDPDAVARLCGTIAEHYAAGTTIAALAELAGFNPQYAMRRFRATTGLRLGEYVQAHRLAHAEHLLRTTQLSVPFIATESGFGSASRFYEVFADAYGTTPARWRKTVRADDETYR